MKTLQEFGKMTNVSIAVQISHSREKIGDPVIQALEDAVESASDTIDSLNDNRRL